MGTRAPGDYHTTGMTQPGTGSGAAIGRGSPASETGRSDGRSGTSSPTRSGGLRNSVGALPCPMIGVGRHGYTRACRLTPRNLDGRRKRTREPMILPPGFYAHDAVTVAKDLLGCLLVHQGETGTAAGWIVEDEAYLRGTRLPTRSGERRSGTAFCSDRRAVRISTGSTACIPASTS